ncbi:MAG: DUF917 family protein [Deltaproteobacteria bacterium]|nr:DUF917 family protein [Deltaproteobacteria bacterium]
MNSPKANKIVLGQPQDFKNIIQGATLFASGGGGSKTLALKFLDQSGITGAGVSIDLYNSAGVPDQCLLAFVAELFAPEKMQKNPDFTCGVNAYYDLMNQKGPVVSSLGETGILFGEIGAVNVAVPMIIAYKNKNFLIDGASVGRAVAELDMTVFASDNIPMGALVVAARGEEKNHFFVIGHPETPDEAELFINNTMKEHEKEYKDVAGFALYKMSGQDLKKISNLPRFGITQSKKIGEIMYQASSPSLAYQTLIPPKGRAGGNSLSNIVSKTIFTLFDGVVKSKHTTSGAQSDGMVTYKNKKNPEESYTVYYENENVLSKYEVTDGTTTIKKYSVIAPDAICYLLKDQFWENGLSYSNSEIDTNLNFFQNSETSIIGIPYPDMRTPYLENSFLKGIQGILDAIKNKIHIDPGVTCPDNYESIEDLNRIPKPNIDIIPNGWSKDNIGAGARRYLIQIDCGNVANISIRYTMDGTLPTLASPEYTAPVHYWAEQGGTLKVIAYDLNYDNKGTYKHFSRESIATLPCSPWAFVKNDLS